MNVSDYIMAYKILKDLGTPWNKYRAFELGLIDDKGNKLKKAETPEEKDAVTSYMKIIFNLKRLLQKAVGKNNLAQQIVSLFLLKESVNEPRINENIINYIIKSYNIDEFKCKTPINENHQNLFIQSFIDANTQDY